MQSQQLKKVTFLHTARCESCPVCNDGGFPCFIDRVFCQGNEKNIGTHLSLNTFGKHFLKTSDFLTFHLKVEIFNLSNNLVSDQIPASQLMRFPSASAVL